MTLQTVIIRADGNSEIGLGHVMRMSALASALKALGASVSLVYKSCPEQILVRFRRKDCHLVRIEDETSLDIELSTLADANYIVLDGYHFDTAYQENLRMKTRATLLVVDDNAHLPSYDCDLLLNQNAFIDSSLYSGKTNAKLLTGLDYVLLRDEFIELRQRTAQPETIRRLLITMGGSDPENVTAKAVQAAAATPYKFTVIMGAAGSNIMDIGMQLMAFPQASLIVAPENMASILAEHDLVVSAGGTTVWEAAYLGIPNIVIITAANQAGVDRFAKHGACISLGLHTAVTVAALSKNIVALAQDIGRRRSLSNISTSLVDGKGAARVAGALLELNGP